MTDYPYMMSNNKIGPIITKIQQAARPAKFTQEVLKNLGFTSTNDRAFIPLFKKLGFLLDDGTPSALYDQLKDATCTSTILGVQIKALYADLYAINTEIHKETYKNEQAYNSLIEIEKSNEEYTTRSKLCVVWQRLMLHRQRLFLPKKRKLLRKQLLTYLL